MMSFSSSMGSDQHDSSTALLQNSLFMRACRREQTTYTPIWLMRQAGRYQPSYRQLRCKAPFLEICKRPELATEATLAAVDQFGFDAAIIFSDILLITEPMGVKLAFHEGRGPVIDPPVRSANDISLLQDVEPVESLDFVLQAIRMTRQALRDDIPLIGFCGAPFTVAGYMIEGQTSRQYRYTKMLMYNDSGAWHTLMEHIVRASARYLNAQLDAGAQAVQLFDSWVGCLSEADYREFVLPHTIALVEAIKSAVPIIHFSVDGAVLLNAINQINVNVIGLDWRVNLADAWKIIGYGKAVQGNLDPMVLFTSPSEIRRRAHAILDQAAGRPGHIFNLGHGVLPETPVDNVRALVEAVHEYQQK